MNDQDLNLFVVHRADHPLAIVRASGPTQAIAIAMRMFSVPPTIETPHACARQMEIRDLQVRPPTEGEALRFSMQATRYHGEARLAALPL